MIFSDNVWMSEEEDPIAANWPSVARSNWSIPPFMTPDSTNLPFKTQCWGPSSKALDGCTERSMDGLQCWSTFISKECNEVDPPRVGDQNNLVGPAAPLPRPHTQSVNPLPTGSLSAVSNMARHFRTPVDSTSLCFRNSATIFGDGVVTGAGFPACLNNSV